MSFEKDVVGLGQDILKIVKWPQIIGLAKMKLADSSLGPMVFCWCANAKYALHAADGGTGDACATDAAAAADAAGAACVVDATVDPSIAGTAACAGAVDVCLDQ
eukprot:2433541-Alexandrium_andersonii.AAC.1